MRSALLCAVCVSAVACAEVERTYDQVVDLVAGDDRTPGAKMKLAASDVASREHCESLSFPYVRLDLSEVRPTRIEPGGKINHRLIYTMCPDALGRRIRGVLTTTIFHGNEKVFTDVARNLELKPGQWIVDADIVIPPAAKYGGYVLQVDFRGGGVTLGDSTSFTVSPT
jgi:hypothetical protein